MGCGRSTALRMMLAATGFMYGQGTSHRGSHRLQYGLHLHLSIQPLQVSWTNSLFENAPADAMGVRARWTSSAGATSGSGSSAAMAP